VGAAPLDAQPIRIDAPSALLGFFLALRLQGHDAHVVDLGDRWVVEVSAATPREWVLTTVQRWLDEEALDEVDVHIGGEKYTMKRAR
jgi:hypothetical protein